MKIVSAQNDTFQLLAPRTPEEATPYISQIGELYKQAFGDDIWCEGKKCLVCTQNYSFSVAQGREGRCCNRDLVDFYSADELVAMLDDLFARRFRLRLVLNNSSLVGCQWGWITDLNSLNRQKLQLTPRALSQLQCSLEERGWNDAELYYRSENAVLPEMRRKGLASAMFQSIRASLRGEVRVCISRTSPQSAQFLLSQKYGDTQVFSYQDNGAPGEKLPDTRVLFVGLLT